MTDREYLVSLIVSAVNGCSTYWAGLIADYLLEHGVVIPIRCGECIYNEMGACNLAECNNPQYDENYYCRDGERKED